MFALLALVPFIATAAVLAENVDVRGYSNAVGCSGGFFHNTNGGALCVTFPTGFHGSAQWVGLPAGTQGQGYGDGGCTQFLFSEFGPGSPCHTTGGQGFDTLNWFHSPQSRSGAVAARGEEACEGPTGFVYEAEDGVERRIAVKDKDHAEVLAGLYLAGNLAELAKH